jgi:hypothetical protein
VLSRGKNLQQIASCACGWQALAAQRIAWATVRHGRHRIIIVGVQAPAEHAPRRHPVLRCSHDLVPPVRRRLVRAA